MYPLKQCTKIFMFLAILGASACTKKEAGMNPEEILETYVKIALNAKSEKDKASLEEYLTGEALKKLKLMSQSDFVDKLVRPEFKFVKFSTRDMREESNGGVSLVYELTFENKTGDSKAKVINRKIAYFRKNAENAWKIFDTRNVKSFIEMKDGLDVMNFNYP